jgi:hypothetical protein
VTTFSLIHGAGDGGWYWHLVEAVLRERGHDSARPSTHAARVNVTWVTPLGEDAAST